VSASAILFLSRHAAPRKLASQRRSVGDHWKMSGHPLFAALYDRLTARAERAGLADLRADVIAPAAGRTLEVGAGTGANAPHYPEGVTEVVFTEPDPHMARRLRDRLATNPPRPSWEVVEAGAEELPFDDVSFDTVVVTLVLCTVDDPGRVAQEIARVLRPDGRLLLLEHVRDPGAGGLGSWQNRLRRPWGWFAGGCHPNRDTAGTLAGAGFDLAGVEPTELPAAPALVRPAIRGEARPPNG
jgi:SAM-dependent methyltransferase